MNEDNELNQNESPSEFENTNGPAVVEGVVNVTSFLSEKKWLLVAILSSSLFFFIFIIAVVFLLKNSDNLNYVTGTNFVNEDYEKLYAEVENVVSNYRSKYGVTVDKYLIIATLTALEDNEMYFDETASGAYNNVLVEEDDDSGSSYHSIDEMTAKIEILAKYQIMTTKSCSDSSDSMREIASNDSSTTIFNFWTSAASREKNYNCNGSSAFPSYSLSTAQGNIDNDNSGSTFYWNLIDEDFLVEYYPEFFDEILDHKLYETHAAKAIEYIYLYADSLKNIDCYNNSSGGMAENFTYNSTSCQEVTVLPDSNGRYAGTYQLEEYVAGVINDEFSPSYMNAIAGSGHDAAIKENLKAFAIAIRSFVIHYTNNCQKAIGNSSNSENFAPTDDAIIWEAVNETAGVVLTYNNQIISAMYDSFGGRNNCPDGDFCYDTYTKIPGTEKHTVKVPLAWRSYMPPAQYHHRMGMSQLSALYLAVYENKNYQEILKFFYDDNVEFQRLAGTTSSGGGNSAYCQRTSLNNVTQNDNNGNCDSTTEYSGKTVVTGNKSVNLLACTADRASEAFDIISEACGEIPLDDEIIDLENSQSTSVLSTNLRYAGRAFDFDYREGMQKEDTYFYVTKDNVSGTNNSNYYRLYCKVVNDVENDYIKTTAILPVFYSTDTYKPTSKVSISDKFLDVTAVLNDHGLYGVGPRACMDSGNYMCSQWWHFQDTSGLVKNETTFEQILNQYYGKDFDYSGTIVEDYLDKKWNGGDFS